MAWLLISLAISALIIYTVVSCYGFSPGMRNGAWLLPIIFGLIAAFFISFAHVVQAGLTFVGIVFCLAVRARPVFAKLVCVAAAVAGCLFSDKVAMSLNRRDEHRRNRFPLVSISRRLDYEKQSPFYHVNQPDSPQPATVSGLSASVAKALQESEERSYTSTRASYLKLLHEEQTYRFIQSPGFGAERIASIVEHNLEGREQGPVPQRMTPLQELPDPSTLFPPGGSRAPSPNADKAAPETIPTVGVLESSHAASLGEFVGVEDIGYVKDIDHVAGFTSHRFTRWPRFDASEAAMTEWKMTRLELVSLLKHETPVVYVSEFLPQMDLLDDAATRPLDAFEAESLPKLRRDEDLVVKEETNRIRMLGSIRAAKDCLKCHSVLRGALLGAFSYELMRINPAPAPPRRTPAF